MKNDARPLADQRVVHIEGVSKSFEASGARVDVLRDVSLTLQAGTLSAMVGESGAGKSTLLGIMGGLLRPDTGQVAIGSVPISALGGSRAAAVRRSHIGIVFQAAGLLPQFTALDNVALAHTAGLRAGRERAAALLNMVGLGRRVGHRPHQLSAGEQQRVAFARAMINDPELILADEPTGNLDEATQRSLLELMRSIVARGCAMFVVTHAADVADAADIVLELRNGTVPSAVRP